jgi:hypothetical protein
MTHVATWPDPDHDCVNCHGEGFTADPGIHPRAACSWCWPDDDEADEDEDTA